MPNLIKLNGLRFGKLTVIRRSRKRGDCALWICLCDCGVKKVMKSSSLTHSRSRSCGCGMASTQFKPTHKLCHTPEYRSWCGMMKRCESYPTYISKGISVCDRWMHSFENFFADMGVRPSKDHSIDRIDNNGNYEPSNCRWATHKEQNRNYSRNRIITYMGKSMCVTEWAESFNMDRHRIYQRLNKGWPLHLVFSH